MWISKNKLFLGNLINKPLLREKKCHPKRKHKMFKKKTKLNVLTEIKFEIRRIPCLQDGSPSSVSNLYAPLPSTSTT